MAFRRRRSRGMFRRRIGKPFAKERTTWVTTLFNEVATASAVVGEMVLFDAADVDFSVALPSGSNMVYHIKRILFNAVVMWVPSISSANLDVNSLVWAIYTVDTEDTDNDLNNTGASSLLRTERIVQSGVVGTGAQGATAGQLAGGIFPGMPINVDVRFPVKCRADEVLVFGVQQMSATGTAFGVQPAISAISRVLVVPP